MSNSVCDLSKTRNKFCNGFTLLEVLLALILGMLLIVVLLQNYLGAKKVYSMQSEVARFSEDVRFADFVLRENIMHAGYAGCRKISELKPKNHTDKDFNVIRGYSSVNMPVYLLKKAVVQNTDVIVIAKANSDITTVVKNVLAGDSSIKVEKNPATQNNQPLLISDCEKAEVFEAKNHSGRTIKAANGLTNSYRAGYTQVGRFEEMAFFISDTKRVDDRNQPIYALYFLTNRGDKQELIPGISDMQVEYGVDTHHRGKVDKRLKASEFEALELWDKVLSVDITLKPQNQLLAMKQWKIYIKLRER